MFILLLIQTLWGYDYNDLLIDAQSRIYPKLLMLQEGLLHNKEKEKPLVLTIVYMPEDEAVARKIVRKIEHYHDHRIGEYRFVVRMASYEALDRLDRTDALYLLKADDTSLKHAVEIGSSKKIPVFVYDFNDLESGALLALTIERSTVIYLNRDALKKGPRFSSTLYSIARFMDVQTN
ncbi:hypothetical protein HCR_04190 [Hydrogenimonas cancrithermarum]|uniref:YfiR family protein n=2 Tax=Hydrogenimonas cancrithermarum TaxID=2993563 RepID=A0ABM8FIJ0_9BACT|nr:hypothetical protein HCR_04190 [Hydrogenimonas cancrithermarum]